MTKYCFCILIFFFIIITCVTEKGKMIYIIHLPDGNSIKYCSDIIEGYSLKDTIHVYADTLYELYSSANRKYYLIEAGRGSNVTGIVYLSLSNNKYEVMEQSFDPYTVFNIDTKIHDLDGEFPPEVISIWNHEGDVYYIRVDRITTAGIKNIFVSKDLGVVPLTEVNRPMYVKNDSLIFLYMLDDGSAYKKAILNYDSSGKLVLQTIKIIPFESDSSD